MRIIVSVDGADNVIEATPEFAEQWYPGAWRLDEYQPVIATASVFVCTPAQGLVALYAMHSITQEGVQDAITGISDPATRYTAQIAFNRATEWRRDSPTMGQLTELLGLSGVDLDALFAFAATVEL